MWYEYYTWFLVVWLNIFFSIFQNDLVSSIISFLQGFLYFCFWWNQTPLLFFLLYWLFLLSHLCWNDLIFLTTQTRMPQGTVCSLTASLLILIHFLMDPIHLHDLKYHIHYDDSQTDIFNHVILLTFQLLFSISSWMSHR